MTYKNMIERRKLLHIEIFSCEKKIETFSIKTKNYRANKMFFSITLLAAVPWHREKLILMTFAFMLKDDNENGNSFSAAAEKTL